MTVDRTQTLNWVRFVATKFYGPDDPWIYSRDTGNLKYIRYASDYSGRNHWRSRLARAFNPKRLLGLDTISKQLRRTPKDLKSRFIEACVHVVVSLRKEKHLPDGMLSSGVITPWEEDGEYIMFFGPTVGVKILDWIEAEPDNPHAIAVVEEMMRVVNLSYPGEENDDSN